jgi:alpha-galactosidase
MNMIRVNEQGDLFQLSTPSSSYVLGLFKGLPVHYWWGAPIEADPRSMGNTYAGIPPYSVADDPEDPAWSSARLRLECAAPLAGDLRSPTLSARSSAGPLFEPRIQGWRVYQGRPELGSLPAARGNESDAETLELSLLDSVTGLKVILYYTVFEGSDVLARSSRLENGCASAIDLEAAPSFSLDLALGGELELLSFDGSWARERSLGRRALDSGTLSIGSLSGASSHGCSPAAIVARPWTTEGSGEAWSATLVYSGNWAMSFERGEAKGLRWSGGINPEGFSWRLEPGESLDCPEALLCYSSEGLSSLSRSWHSFLKDRILPPLWAKKERPVLINNWEATYFDFDEEKLVELGVELFVLDDGWFGRRDDDTTSLGDWYENPRKLPDGLGGLAKRVRALGLKFGLWVEPESVSPDSELYREHPDWCLHLPGRPRAEGRNQLLLDLGRAEVRAELAARLKAVFSSCEPDYVKWDMNRHLGLAGSASLPGERQGESRHRHILGLYKLMEEITSAFPGILFEGCAGGGGRMDYGILRYMPQFWTSDNTDAFSRVGIQYGTSFFFPPIAMGSHVSAVPNHQTSRSTPLGARSAVAFGGNLGYELDPKALSPEEAESVRRDIAWYKERRGLAQLGDYYRLLPSRAAGLKGREDAAWMSVAPDKKRALLAFIRTDALANPYPIFLKLAGLDPELRYRLTRRGEAASAVLAGSELMSRGYELLPGLGDGWTLLADLEAEES